MFSWNNWEPNKFAGLTVKVVCDLKFNSSERENIKSGTKGLVLQRCWFWSPEKQYDYEVYHVFFANHGNVYISTQDLEILD